MDACNKRFNLFYYEPSLGGIDCIAHGMHWFPTDWMSIKHANCGLDTSLLRVGWGKSKKQMLGKIKKQMRVVKKMPTYYNFLKNKIY